MVNTDDAEEAIERGVRITIEDAGSVWNLVSVTFERASVEIPESMPPGGAYPLALA